ncbi:Similar to DNA-(apurinic or apyrimidinic site) lyase 2; acc. no. P87175 [Pyronema omphalodes CBS 100304]|uniref:Similar to DNA-(Apurinic or apyrimidinic site) lyase 2 acc. no. P87175 n=1 Tax=Pyronema omphalodes (strain CBS 100304) TaxID=1076935 RepID=U4LDS8_PYROM|nr:Similar to DNA-(apurinic or apyrimidinic site) lyase 2; acc. no. P87175 [Pyronema omphalodes CBS 100304]
MALRITTWNVNGIRNPFGYHPWSSQKSFQHMFDVLEADIVCFQETKIQQKDLTDDMVIVPGWDSYFTFPKHKKGCYSGLAIYTRNSKCHPVKAEEGITGILESQGHAKKTYKSLPDSECIGGYPDLSNEEAVKLDSEGRALVLDFGAFVLIGVYCPAATDSARDHFRIAQVIVVGDLNIARDEIDAAGAKDMMKELGMRYWKETPTRKALDLLLDPNPAGQMVDLCREFFPHRVGMYTCWDVKKNKRPGNSGSRIDYILCSTAIKSWFLEANIQEGLMGSDHCPVYATLKPTVNYNGIEKSILDIINPESMFHQGERQSDISTPQPPRLCMKRYPEFTRRQNIKDMFNKMTSAATMNSGEKVQRHGSDSQGEPPLKKIRRDSAMMPFQRPRLPVNNTQKTLHGFFQHSPDVPNSSSRNSTAHKIHQPIRGELPMTNRERDLKEDTEGVVTESTINAKQNDFLDQTDSKKKWSLLFTKKRPPVCDGHGEECIQLSTKKPGPNCGRAFWANRSRWRVYNEVRSKIGMEM